MLNNYIKSLDEFIRKLILSIPFLNKPKPETVYTKIIGAAKKGDLQYLKYALAHDNPNFDVADETGMTPLFFALERSDTPMIEFLIKQKVNINHLNIFGRTPLFSAVNSDNPKMISYVIEHGGDPSICDANNQSLLHYTILNKKEKVFFDLLETEKCPINHQDNFGKTALNLAAEMGVTTFVKNLLGKGAIIDVPDNDGWTPLMYAASKGLDDLVSLLISAGADVHHKDRQFDQTAYLIAIRNGHIDVAQILQRSGANVEDKDYYNRTALHIAVETNSFETVEYVLTTSVELGAKDKFNLTAKEWAIVNSTADILRAILKAEQR